MDPETGHRGSQAGCTLWQLGLRRHLSRLEWSLRYVGSMLESMLLVFIVWCIWIYFPSLHPVFANAPLEVR